MKRELRELVRAAADEGVEHPRIEGGNPHVKLIGLVGDRVFCLPCSATRGMSHGARRAIRQQVARLRAYAMTGATT
jgi:hypothetical protein